MRLFRRVVPGLFAEFAEAVVGGLLVRPGGGAARLNTRGGWESVMLNAPDNGLLLCQAAFE